MLQRPVFEPQIGRMLPDIKAPVGKEQRLIPLRSDRGETTVILWRHSCDCDRCDSFLQGVAGLTDEFRVWDARLVVVGAPLNHPDVPAFAQVAGAFPLALQGAGILVADRYGQIFYVLQGTDNHVFPSPRELEEWLKHLGTLCPE